MVELFRLGTDDHTKFHKKGSFLDVNDYIPIIEPFFSIVKGEKNDLFKLCKERFPVCGF